MEPRRPCVLAENTPKCSFRRERLCPGTHRADPQNLAHIAAKQSARPVNEMAHVRHRSLEGEREKKTRRVSMLCPIVDNRRSAGVDMSFQGIVDLAKQTRQVARGLLRSPGFTLTVVATIALSIGAITTMFSVIEAVLLRPLPYHAPAR